MMIKAFGFRPLLVLGIFTAVVGSTSCKKEKKEKIPTDYLVSFIRNHATNVLFRFEYDNQNRISKVYENKQLSKVYVYTPEKITVFYPMVENIDEYWLKADGLAYMRINSRQNKGETVRDTTYLFFNANRQLMMISSGTWYTSYVYEGQNLVASVEVKDGKSAPIGNYSYTNVPVFFKGTNLDEPDRLLCMGVRSVDRPTSIVERDTTGEYFRNDYTYGADGSGLVWEVQRNGYPFKTYTYILKPEINGQ